MPEPQLKPPFLSLIPPKPSLFRNEKLLTDKPLTADLPAGEPFTADLLAGEPFVADLLAGEPFVADLLAGELVTPSPHKVVAGEADGSIKFGQAERFAYLFDPDITDGRSSVNGINAVLPPDAALRLSSSIKRRKPRRERGRSWTAEGFPPWSLISTLTRACTELPLPAAHRPAYKRAFL